MSEPEYPDTIKNRVEACLKLKVPKSGVPWVDALIQQCRDLELLQAGSTALCGKIKGNDGSPRGCVDSVAQYAFVSKAEDNIRAMLQRVEAGQ